MVSRKRSRSDVDVDAAQSSPDQSEEKPGLLHRLRNCWEFANLMQFITMFGRLMRIDEDFEIDVRGSRCGFRGCCAIQKSFRALANSGLQDLENECLKTEPSEKLLEIGLCLLKWVSSHRGLTYALCREWCVLSS